MTQLQNYRDLPSFDDEDQLSYVERLESDGHEEMFIRKALRYHFGMGFGDFGSLFESFPIARMRHVRQLRESRPQRSDYSLALKVAKNLDISHATAARLVAKLNSNTES